MNIKKTEKSSYPLETLPVDLIKTYFSYLTPRGFLPINSNKQKLLQSSHPLFTN